MTPKRILTALAILTGAVFLAIAIAQPAPPKRSRPPQDPALSRLPRGPEWRPPPGTERLLGPEQLRYCLSEDIRLVGARKLPLTAAEIDRFRVLIADYNERCAEHRYRKDERDAMMTTEIEPRRALLEKEGAAYFGR